MRKKKQVQVGQKVRHPGFKGIGIIVQICGGRVAADFPGTNGIIDDWHHFTLAKAGPRKPRRSDQSYSVICGEYD